MAVGKLSCKAPAGLLIWSNLGFSVLTKDTSTCEEEEEPGSPFVVSAVPEAELPEQMEVCYTYTVAILTLPLW